MIELVETEDPGTVAAVLAALLAAGLDVRHEPGTAVLDVTGADADVVADRVRDAIADAGARVRRIAHRRRRLEDLFEGAGR
jgi:hypothetical protein